MFVLYCVCRVGGSIPPVSFCARALPRLMCVWPPFLVVWICIVVLVLVISSFDLRKFLHIYYLWGSPVPFWGPAHQGLILVVFWGCLSCFGPRLSGLNPVGGFFSVFSFFFIMPRRFPCSVSIDVKEFAGLGKTRPEIVSVIINSFHPIKPIVAIQFLGYDAKVTFESEAHKHDVMTNEYVSIEGIECSVRGGGWP